MASNDSDRPLLAAAPGALDPLVATALAALRAGAEQRGGPAPAGTPAALGQDWTARLAGATVEGIGADAALAEVVGLLAAGSVEPADPRCTAHLHCPPLAVAVAADLATSALNPSLDSWDQAPVATAIEPAVIATLARLAGLPAGADGVLTTGGSESNLMGLLLARERAVAASTGRSAVRSGLPAAVAGRGRIFGSAVAHFSLHRAAGFLGLGEDAVVPVGTGRDHRMDPAALAAALTAAEIAGDLPVAVVATAGTTDLGAIDPLPEIAAVAAQHGVWLHVDAAYGGGALFSAALAPLLAGLGAADSIALDLHKLGWQPVAAGVFLVREAASLAALARRAEYLNPADDEDAGYVSLLGRSLRTTRRPDAVKIAVTLRAFGTAGLGALVDRCHALAGYAAARIDAEPALELYQRPGLTTVVFRHRGGDAINATLRRELLAAGSAVVGRTTIDAAVWLKFTLLNPVTTEADLDGLIADIIAAGDRLAAAAERAAAARVAAAGGLAERAAVQALLRCWVRERGLAVPATGETLTLELAGTKLTVPVEYRSLAGWHRFGPVRRAAGEVGATELAGLLLAEAGGAAPAPDGGQLGDDLVGRVADSTSRIARYLAAGPASAGHSFLDGERAQVLGHPLHPTPKSRVGFTADDDAAFGPELAGRTPLHWFAVAADLVRQGSAYGPAAADRLAGLAPAAIRDRRRGDEVLVPAHPWQARQLAGALGPLRDLGLAGPAWAATSSVRTLYRADAPVMLKFSLGVRITNSRREHRRPELVRGEEMARLFDAGLGAALATAHPEFGVLADPAWLAVPLPGETDGGASALSVLCRENPFYGPAAEGVGGADGGTALSVAGLLAERPDRPAGRSLHSVILSDVDPVEWVGRYVDAVIAPVLWLHAVHGLGLEAHQQNTIVRLDRQGWPIGGYYRDNQGYYVSPTRAGALFGLVPGLGAGSGVIDPDPVIDERLAYYVGVNNLLGVVGAVGAAGLADETEVLRAVRSRLTALAARLPAGALLDALLDAETLPCKANLLTRVAGLDELTGPVAAQSVYVPIPNPFRKV